MLRVLLILLLVHGLVPSFGEAIELVVHYASTGHVAHEQVDESDLGDLGREHGCGPTQHHCGCCVSQFVAPAAPPIELAVTRSASQKVIGKALRETGAFASRLLRPPIGA
ncbi:hypothetical protein LZ198_11215 [Myxococcus sp. K15C18031901]|uniref:hypothetical protein n=1 Tax=Myxococcus dinghuensis TaxID=2906761 RepID=UPI0020A767CD|nr:hypothetical protein [Myxococcus dinghuensis]MCP3099439.1 hypothetical protein [Myxococcus dinghuensis]